MKIHRIAVVVFVAIIASYSSRLLAQGPYPKKAVLYYVTLVRGMDECVGPGVTVVNPGGIVGCEQQNISTSSTLDFSSAAVKLYRTVDGIYIRLRAVTETPISLQLRLRTTNEHGLPSSTSKTYQDFTILCGDSTTGPEALVCPLYMQSSEGRIYLKQRLTDCLAANGLDPSLGTGNVEVLDAALISCDTTPAQPGAVPGIFLK